MACPDDNALAAFVSGSLTAPQREKIESHLDGCAACSELLGELGRLAASQVKETPAAPSEDDDSQVGPGRMLGRYALRQLIGQGAMGQVYSAHDSALERRVALKLVHPERWGARAPEGRERLAREAQAMARVAHPNVVAVHDVGEADGLVFIAMELVEGPSLDRWIRLESPSTERVLEVFAALARGLHAAHMAGIVHRDFKPSNALIDADGRARVADFGLALPEADASVGVAGAHSGTRDYMAPEQIRGAGVTPKSDQYSFFVALFEALFARHPRGAKASSDLGLAWPEHIRRSDPLAVAVARGLSPLPQDRFESMRQVADALDQLRDRRTAGHLKAHTVAQLVLTVFHVAMTLVVVALSLQALEDLDAGVGEDLTGDEQALWLDAWLLVVLFTWVPTGILWAPINAWGLSRRRAWARLSTLGYAVACLPSGLVTPYGLYALWSLTREPMRRLFRPDASRP